ncbi:DUF2264 domain-containing protein [Cohnella mopanensis]|uniref:DUF2264 domain-containing protein n=1 Tax=Cohnella mopanensis TaxID=2911966 RepID=UPI001EF8FF1E|nr:DUF2264 domain-containing protein [Cohnella mopanensis]
MIQTQLALRDNPLRTKEDMRLALRQLVEPLESYYSEGCARLRLEGSGAAYPASIAEMEGFSRVLWGMVPHLAGGGNDPIWDICLKGIVNGTDPVHEEYWGAPGDNDQRFVEMAVIGFALAVIPEQIWTPLTIGQQNRLREWLSTVNRHPVYDCNWLFFPVLVNIGLRKLGLPYDAEGMERNLDRLEQFSVDGGWYTDGPGGHSDYYTPFAIHYYGLMYAKLMGGEDPQRSMKFKANAALFARDFIRWFSADGSAIPYGRSLAYRFAQSAFWSALAYAEAVTEEITFGVIKGIVLRNLRWWFKQSIFRPDGVLAIGYAYPNLVMAENYNAPGSPYWAMKAFLPLAFADDHPFWTEEELPLPDLHAIGERVHPSLVVVRQSDNNHVAAFNTGHLSSNEHTHTSAKYEKFAYSNLFGFSVPRAEWGLAQGAFDSMLALSERDNLFRVRRRNEETFIRDRVLYSRWKPWQDVEVKTWIIAGLPWHVRVHRIETGRELTVAEGGFALPIAADMASALQADRASASCSIATSGIVGLLGFEGAELIYPNANTNLMYPRTVIPTLKANIDVGIHWVISAVYGQPGAVPASFLLEGDDLERLVREWVEEEDQQIDTERIIRLSGKLFGEIASF